MPYLTEAKVKEMIEKAESSRLGDYKELTNNIWLVFSSPDSLNKSFLLPKGEEERAEACKASNITVDVGAVRRTFASLFSLELESVRNTMVNAMEVYCSQLQREKAFTLKQPLNHFVVLFENPLLHSPEFMKAFPKLLQVVAKLPVQRKELLVHWYSYYSAEELRTILSSLQQLITLQLLFSDDDDHPRAYIPQSDPAIVSATKTMTILCFANLLKGKREGRVRPMSRHLSSVAAKTKSELMQMEDSEYEQLLFRMKVHPANATSTPIPFAEFLNEELNSRVNMGIDYQRDYVSGVNGEKNFSFIEYPFILNAANKVEKLFRDNLVSQFGERQRTLFHAVLTGVPDIPFLMLRVDRNNMLSDTLVQVGGWVVGCMVWGWVYVASWCVYAGESVCMMVCVCWREGLLVSLYESLQDYIQHSVHVIGFLTTPNQCSVTRLLHCPVLVYMTPSTFSELTRTSK